MDAAFDLSEEKPAYFQRKKSTLCLRFLSSGRGKATQKKRLPVIIQLLLLISSDSCLFSECICGRVTKAKSKATLLLRLFFLLALVLSPRLTRLRIPLPIIPIELSLHSRSASRENNAITNTKLGGPKLLFSFCHDLFSQANNCSPSLPCFSVNVNSWHCVYRDRYCNLAVVSMQIYYLYLLAKNGLAEVSHWDRGMGRTLSGKKDSFRICREEKELNISGVDVTNVKKVPAYQGRQTNVCDKAKQGRPSFINSNDFIVLHSQEGSMHTQSLSSLLFCSFPALSTHVYLLWLRSHAYSAATREGGEMAVFWCWPLGTLVFLPLPQLQNERS